MKFLHALLFAFLINLGLSAQSDLTHILNKMTQINCYMGPAVYESGEKPEQYSLYEILRKTATKDQLKSLLSHKNGVIRAYSLQALIARNEEMDWDAIALASFSDTEKVETQFGCLGGKESVGDIFLDLLVQKISPQTKKEIQKELLRKRSASLYTIDILFSQEKDPDFYPLLKEWALEGNEYAIFALAKYQKQEDYQLVLSLKDKNDKYLFFRACPYILNDSLKPYFQDYMDSILPSKFYDNEWEYFYKSLAMFKDDFSKNLLKKVFSSKTNKNIRKYHLDYMVQALSPYTDGFYDDILFHMWKNYHAVNIDVAKNLYARNKNQTLDSMISTLNHSEKYFDKTETLAFSIESLLKEGTDVGAIFIKKLPNLSVSVFEEFFRQINRFDNDSVNSALLNRLKTETNGYIIIPVYDHLLSKKNQKINRKVLKIYTKNKSKYKDWTQKDVQKTLEKWGLL